MLNTKKGLCEVAPSSFILEPVEMRGDFGIRLITLYELLEEINQEWIEEMK